MSFQLVQKIVAYKIYMNENHQNCELTKTAF